MFNDTISDMLTRIRNANLIKSKEVSIPFTRISHQICQILEKEGFIKSFQIKSSRQVSLHLKYKNEGEKPGFTNLRQNSQFEQGKKPGITNLRRISKPGLRIYANHKEIPKVLGGMGVVIISTSQGIMTGQEAQFRHIGGELLCSIW